MCTVNVSMATSATRVCYSGMHIVKPWVSPPMCTYLYVVVGTQTSHHNIVVVHLRNWVLILFFAKAINCTVPFCVRTYSLGFTTAYQVAGPFPLKHRFDVLRFSCGIHWASYGWISGTHRELLLTRFNCIMIISRLWSWLGLLPAGCQANVCKLHFERPSKIKW